MNANAKGINVRTYGQPETNNAIMIAKISNLVKLLVLKCFQVSNIVAKIKVTKYNIKKLIKNLLKA
jgi:hypothetical protein